MTNKIKTIVWDIDDVLNDLTRAWFENDWLPRHPGCALCYADLYENPPHNLLGISQNDYLYSLDCFRLSKQASAMQPDEHLIKWFELYGEYFRHIALTARPTKTVAASLSWLLDHFGPWYQTFSFVPSPRPGYPSHQPDTSKSDFLEWIEKADYFIDDNETNVAQAEKLGIRAFLHSRPWNSHGISLPEILKHLIP